MCKTKENYGDWGGEQMPSLPSPWIHHWPWSMNAEVRCDKKLYACGSCEKAISVLGEIAHFPPLLVATQHTIFLINILEIVYFFLLFLLKYHSFFLNIPNLCHVTTSVLSVTYATLTHPISPGTVGMWLCENTRWEWRYRSANPWFFDEPFNSRHLCASCVVYVKHEQLFYHIIIFKIILQFESIVYSQQAYI